MAEFDIFPRFTDPGTMEDRRAVLQKALKVAGMVAGTGMLKAVAPYVRLPADQGTEAEERTRFEQEIDAVANGLLLQPAGRTQPLLVALWANLSTFPRTATASVFDLRARVAILASVNAVTLADRNGYVWLQQAHTYARLSGDRDLVSLAHSKAANAAMYFPEIGPRPLLADAQLAIRYATTPERSGMAKAMFARALGRAGHSEAAVKYGEQAVALATPPARGMPPRTEGWVTGQAHMTVARALCGFRQLRPAVEEHVRAALGANPAAGTLWRAQPLLNVAEVRVRDGELSGAANVISGVLAELSPAQLQPSLRQRVREVADLADRRYPGTRTFRPVREQMAELGI